MKIYRIHLCKHRVPPPGTVMASASMTLDQLWYAGSVAKFVVVENSGHAHCAKFIASSKLLGYNVYFESAFGMALPLHCTVPLFINLLILGGP